MKKKIEEICNKLNREQLSVTGATNELFALFDISGSFLDTLIEKHESNKKKALENMKIMKDNEQYPWYDATFNNSLLFVWDLKDVKIKLGLKENDH